MHAHPDSPLQKSYDPEVEQSYLDHASSVAGHILEGGVTVAHTPGSTALPVGSDEWYSVGGAVNPSTGSRVNERSLNLSHASRQFLDTESLGHVLRVEGYNIERAAGRTPKGVPWPAAYVGGWRETNAETGEDKAVMDYSDVYYGEKGKRRAVRQGIERGERAVFDAKKIRDIDLPQSK
jgi:hypothetical protein